MQEKRGSYRLRSRTTPVTHRLHRVRKDVGLEKRTKRFERYSRRNLAHEVYGRERTRNRKGGKLSCQKPGVSWKGRSEELKTNWSLKTGRGAQQQLSGIKGRYGKSVGEGGKETKVNSMTTTKRDE